MGTIVAFLDILGFGNYSNTDIDSTLELLADFEYIIEEKIIDSTLHPPESYKDDALKEIAENRTISSFVNFIPCSDSIFIQSMIPDLFLKQLSHFLLGCFLLKSHAYSNPEDTTNPVEVTISSVSSNGVKKLKTNWFPLLFRGGISFGESRVFDINSIHDSGINKTKNIAGAAVVKAVKKLEPLGKGPRLFLDNELYEKLDSVTQDFCLPFSNNNFEFLWPAFHYIDSNDVKSEIAKSSSLIVPAANLWKAYNHYPFGCHYWEFLKLIVVSTQKYAELHSYQNGTVDIVNILNKIGLGDKIPSLLNIE